jgi:hypothetical protein
MAQKKFNRFGLRRDFNLSDLPSPTSALNNVLSTPTMLGSEKSFTTNDLIPIQGIYITDITTSTFASLSGVTVAFTIVENGVIDNTSNPLVYKPLIKIKNRLDAAYFSTGEPFFYGGDGPNAKYYDDENIIRDADAHSISLENGQSYQIGDVVRYNQQLWRRRTNKNIGLPGVIEDWLLIGPYQDLYLNDDVDSDANVITLSDNFWERGNFLYSEKLQASFASLFGGTNWQGFYKPTVSGIIRFLVRTTGSTIFKFQDPSSSSFELIRYGSLSTTQFNYLNGITGSLQGTLYNGDQIDELLAVYNDATRQLVSVKLPNPMQLKHGDLIFIDIEEGQVPSQKYRILTPIDYDKEIKITEFFIEVTEEFNKLNLDSTSLDEPSNGWGRSLTSGGYFTITDLPEGLKGAVRYTPYDRKALKTYINSYRHRTNVAISPTNTISSTQFTVTDTEYENLMVNDYIYDYRYSIDDPVPGIRRYVITNCSSSNGVNTITVEIDETYDELDTQNNNDQQYYYSLDGSPLTSAFENVTSGTSLVSFTAAGSITGSVQLVEYNATNDSVISDTSIAVAVGDIIDLTSNNSYWSFTPSANITFDYVLRGGQGGGGVSVNRVNGATVTGQFQMVANTTYTVIKGLNAVNVTTGLKNLYTGNGGNGGTNGYMGGGFTGLFTEVPTGIAIQNALIIAAGGGGSTSDGKLGGKGGAPNGEGGQGANAGSGGTQNAGGSGGLGGSSGAELEGGNGESDTRSGGGGGGGYYGGGGGRSDNDGNPGGSGGGGGASYVAPNMLSTYDVQAQEQLNDNTELDVVYTSGAIDRTLAQSNTFNTLLHVARMGELTLRERYITIEQYLDRYVDYIFDWTFFMKDDDVVQGSTNKAWIIRQRTETSGGYGFVNYKNLYDKDYEFYQIGDFKTFLDNSVVGGGTSREDGVEQRAFGRKQLVSKADQYNLLFSILPVKSIYTPRENWNSVSLIRTGSMVENSRLLTLNNGTDIEVGNYVINNNDNGFTIGDTIPYGTRVVSINNASANVVTSKQSDVAFSNSSLWILDHRGFVGTGTLTYDATNNVHYFNTNSPRLNDVNAGQVIVFRDSPSTSTYVRITKATVDEPNSRVELKIDDQNPYPTSNGGPVAIYQDKGIDITKPLQTYCNGVSCAQNNYKDAGTVNTVYFPIKIHSGSPLTGNDVRWTESSLTGTYNTETTIHPSRMVFTPTQTFRNTSYNSWGTGPSVAWWMDAYTGSSFVNQATKVAGSNNSTGKKRFGGGQVYAQLSGTELGAAIQEQYPNFPVSGFFPVGIIEGMIRVDGDIWNNVETPNSEKYYFIIRVANTLKSVPNPDNGFGPIWTDGELCSDGSTLKPIKIDLTDFPSSAFNFTKIQFPPAPDNMLPNGGSVTTSGTVGNIFNLYNANINGYADRIYSVGNDITLTETQAKAQFVNSANLIQDDGDGNITYVLKSGSNFKTYSTTGYFLHFDNFEAIIDTETLFTYRQSNVNTVTNTLSSSETELLNLFQNDGPITIQPNDDDNDWNTKQFQYVQYRKKNYSILPTPRNIENRFPGIRMINENKTEGNTVYKNLQNTTNSLSVYTFTSTLTNRELCCPPLDTSPPFDSSAIGLSTTINNPDLYIDGLINVRSIGARHPEDKIHAIPVSIDNDQLPVNEKLKVVFGGVSYDLLVGNSKPF